MHSVLNYRSCILFIGGITGLLYEKYSLCCFVGRSDVLKDVILNLRTKTKDKSLVLENSPHFKYAKSFIFSLTHHTAYT